MTQRRRLALARLTLTLALGAVSAQAQTLKVLYNFTGGQDGAKPFAGLTMDKGGNLYGIASEGGISGCGRHGCGTVFKLSKKGSSWIFDPLYAFKGGNDGTNPILSKVIIGPDGSLYGVTSQGGGGCVGSGGCGTIFNLRPQPRSCTTALCPWVETVLYHFTGGSDGMFPSGNLIFDSTGNLYGTAAGAGMPGCTNGFGCGVAYESTPSNGSWKQTVLYSFTGGVDGGNPSGGLIFDQAGNLYGVTGFFGADNNGTVYKLTPSGSGWTENILSYFQTGAAVMPLGSLIFDQAGNLFGAAYTTSAGGPGAIYKLTDSNGNWELAAAFGFTSPGEIPEDDTLAVDSGGEIYGTALSYDATDCGIVFKTNNNLTNEVTLHAFSGSNGNGPDGCDPAGSVLLDGSGNIYGVTSDGGAYGYGVVWEITP
jgi:uncharacterized repeat protein (TIGR03803 family)